MASSPLIGTLHVHVSKASGKDLAKGAKVFHEYTGRGDGTLLLGFAKMEVRGKGDPPQKAQTASVMSEGLTLSWNEDLVMNVFQSSEELRIMMCMDLGKTQRPRVFANGGIFVKDIVRLGSVKKWFDMYSPGGGSGGSIQLHLKFVPATENEIAQAAREKLALANAAAAGGTSEPPKADPSLGKAPPTKSAVATQVSEGLALAQAMFSLPSSGAPAGVAAPSPEVVSATTAGEESDAAKGQSRGLLEDVAVDKEALGVAAAGATVHENGDARNGGNAGSGVVADAGHESDELRDLDDVVADAFGSVVGVRDDAPAEALSSVVLGPLNEVSTADDHFDTGEDGWQPTDLELLRLLMEEQDLEKEGEEPAEMADRYLEEVQPVVSLTPDEAATYIQAVYRGFRTRCELQAILLAEPGGSDEQGEEEEDGVVEEENVDCSARYSDYRDPPPPGALRQFLLSAGLVAIGALAATMLNKGAAKPKRRGEEPPPFFYYY